MKIGIIGNGFVGKATTLLVVVSGSKRTKSATLRLVAFRIVTKRVNTLKLS